MWEKIKDLNAGQAKGMQDTNKLIADAIKNGALNKAEGKEIINRLKSAKEKISIESRQELLDIAKKWGWIGLIKVIETKTEARDIKSEKPVLEQKTETEKEEKATPEPVKEESSIIDETWKFVSSWFEKVKNIFSSEIDLSKLLENERKIVEELQKSGFKLKPVEGKEWIYEVDMTGLFDKSILTILADWKMKFSTDTIKFAWKDKEFNFKNVDEAKEILTKVNEYIKVSFEIKPLEDIYETHRDFGQQDRYKELDNKREGLERDLWLKFDIK